MTRNQLRSLAAVAAMIALVLVAMPVLGVDPSASPSTGAPASATPSAAPSAAQPSASSSTKAASPAPAGPAQSAEPDNDQGNGNGNGAKPDKAAKPDKGSKTPEHPVTLTGIVGRSAGDEGEYTLAVGSTVYQLSAGPKWWWGNANPLEAAVGKITTIAGEQAQGSTEVDVLKVNGKAIREPGKPPWAGGWKVVGPKHPGWAQWKVDKLANRGHGREGAPGQVKKEDAAP